MEDDIFAITDLAELETRLITEQVIQESLVSDSEDAMDDKQASMNRVNALQQRIDELEAAQAVISPRVALSNSMAAQHGNGQFQQHEQYPQTLRTPTFHQNGHVIYPSLERSAASPSSSSFIEPIDAQRTKRARESTLSSPPRANHKYQKMSPSPSISGQSSPHSVESLEPLERGYGDDSGLHYGMRQPSLAERVLDRSRDVQGLGTARTPHGQRLGHSLPTRGGPPLQSRSSPNLGAYASGHALGRQQSLYSSNSHAAPNSTNWAKSNLNHVLPYDTVSQAQSSAHVVTSAVGGSNAGFGYRLNNTSNHGNRSQPRSPALPAVKTGSSAVRSNGSSTRTTGYPKLEGLSQAGSSRSGGISTRTPYIIDLTKDSDDDEPEIIASNAAPSNPRLPQDRQLQNGQLQYGQTQPRYPPIGGHFNENATLIPVTHPAAYYPGNSKGWGAYASAAANQVLTSTQHIFEGLGTRTQELGDMFFPGRQRAENRMWDRDDLAEDTYGNYGRGWDAATPAETQAQLQELLENIDADEDKEDTPRQLNISLKEHQKIGLAWLRKMEDGTNKGGILADDMGLGKTVQALALILARPSTDMACKTTLIVAPLALMRQWEKEIKDKVHPRYRLQVYIYHGSSKKQDFQYLKRFDCVLTTYGTLATEKKKKEKWAVYLTNNPGSKVPPKERFPLLDNDTKWYRVILDEAQNIKNRETQTSKAAADLRAHTRVCMTGTPMMNNVNELYSLIRFLEIKPYCYWTRFRQDIATPINKWTAADDKEPAMEKLRVLWRAVALRRKKDSKINGQPIIVIPPKVVEETHVVFDDDQKQLYDALEHKAQIRFNKYLGQNKVMNNYANMLVLLLRLRQACCHPHLINDLSIETPGNMTQDGMKDLSAQFAPEVIQRIKDHDGDWQCPICLDGMVNPSLSFPCGHEICLECYGRVTDPANAAQMEDADQRPKCPQCRERLDVNKVVDYRTFCKVHLPDKFPESNEDGEIDDDEAGSDDAANSRSEDDAVESDSEGDSLDGFIVDDDDDDPDGERKYSLKQKAAKIERVPVNQNLFDDESAGPSRAPKQKRIVKDEDDEEDEPAMLDGDKGTLSKPKEKGKGRKKGKEKRKGPPKMTLAQLKKESHKNKASRMRYLRRLEKKWMSSAKIDKTLEILNTIRKNDPEEKTIIFSQWTSLLDLLEVPINRAGFGCQRYDGSMKPAERVDAIEEFTGSKRCTILLTSLKAGNAGLNLHHASQVIMLDPFWNPYIEEQAVDRAHRFPQEKVVHVHRILVEGTVEDRIMELQRKKKELIEAAMDETAGKNIARLGVREFGYLFGLNRMP